MICYENCSVIFGTTHLNAFDQHRIDDDGDDDDNGVHKLILKKLEHNWFSDYHSNDFGLA